mmetsp:Transcript_11119/g.51520  ORF Transcript_11119/g.51520 Transcript_11119/m.51520 type:complete len:242 (-) Transcript_11119:2068-2793(-)
MASAPATKKGSAAAADGARAYPSPPPTTTPASASTGVSTGVSASSKDAISRATASRHAGDAASLAAASRTATPLLPRSNAPTGTAAPVRRTSSLVADDASDRCAIVVNAADSSGDPKSYPDALPGPPPDPRDPDPPEPYPSPGEVPRVRFRTSPSDAAYAARSLADSRRSSKRSTTKLWKPSRGESGSIKSSSSRVSRRVSSLPPRFHIAPVPPRAMGSRGGAGSAGVTGGGMRAGRSALE